MDSIHFIKSRIKFEGGLIINRKIETKITTTIDQDQKQYMYIRKQYCLKNPCLLT